MSESLPVRQAISYGSDHSFGFTFLYSLEFDELGWLLTALSPIGWLHACDKYGKLDFAQVFTLILADFSGDPG